MLALCLVLYMCGVMMAFAYCVDATAVRGHGPDYRDMVMVLLWPVVAPILFGFAAGKLPR